jgi:hypothetical protein
LDAKQLRKSASHVNKRTILEAQSGSNVVKTKTAYCAELRLMAGKQNAQEESFLFM